MNLNYYKKIKRSKDAKTVTENAGYLMLIQISGYFFPLLTMPYLARVIGPEGFGKISFASATILWFITVVDWGFNFTATRDVAQNRDDKEKVSQIFSSVLWARCILCLISFLVLCLMILTIPLFRENKDILLVTFLMIPGHLLFPGWFFQAIERMKFTSFFSLAIKFLFTIAVFAFVKKSDDFILQPLFTTIGFILCGFISMYLILWKWNYHLYRPQWKLIWETIKNSSDVFVNNLMPNLYNSLSVVLLGFWGGTVANGIYDGGSRFVSVIRHFQQVLSRAFYPFLARRGDKHDVFVKINMGLGVLLCLALFVFAPLIVDLMLAQKFAKSVIVLQILSFSIIGLALNNTYGTNFLIVRHHEHILRKITVRTSVIGLAMAIPLVYYYSYIGAAIVITFTRLFMGIQTCYSAVKIKKTNEI